MVRETEALRRKGKKGNSAARAERGCGRTGRVSERQVCLRLSGGCLPLVSAEQV